MILNIATIKAQLKKTIKMVNNFKINCCHSQPLVNLILLACSILWEPIMAG